MKKPFLLAPSILACDFSNMGAALSHIEKAGGDMVHIDVMDGHFVPEISMGADVVASLRKRTALPFDVHLMVCDPERFIPKFAQSGADYITFHYEAAVHVHSLVTQIHKAGAKAGISIVPSTPAAHLSEILGCVELVLVMTVNPGYGGQEMIGFCLDKARQLAQMREKSGLDFLISVDGGVNAGNLSKVLEAGVDVVVSGSAFFTGSLKAIIEERRLSDSSCKFINKDEDKKKK